MTLTYRIKRLAGIDDGEIGVAPHERRIRECTVCSEKFDPDTVACPHCGSQIGRTSTEIPHPLLTLLVVLAAVGLHALRNVLTGNVPPE